jgi:hypothetical protein
MFVAGRGSPGMTMTHGAIVSESPSPKPTHAVPTGLTVSAPPRCNFAGYCNYCNEQGCRSRDCILLYLDTWWAACELCDGMGGDGLGDGCICLYGVVQVGSDRKGAVQPR